MNEVSIMAVSETLKKDSLVRYWPFGVAGFGGPLMSAFVGQWMPFYLAVGASMFVGFAAAVWMFQRTSARGSVGIILVSGLAAGVVGGAVAFLFPWG
jgi:hypothetical protein